uniref:Uncharacterized protein n=1 Tax=Arundo donax TaxID=35708 RepID=A0A0A8ZJD3_ARUDO
MVCPEIQNERIFGAVQQANRTTISLWFTSQK